MSTNNTTKNFSTGVLYAQHGQTKDKKDYTMLVTFVPNPYGGQPVKIVLQVKSSLERDAVLQVAIPFESTDTVGDLIDTEE